MKTVEPLGRRFFWVKSTGNIVAQRNEMSAGIESTKEEDFAVYVELKPYEPDAIEMTTFKTGQYKEEFEKASDWRFNPETGTIEFLYPDPDNPEQPPVYQPPLTEQVKELKAKNAELEKLVEEKDRENKNAIFEIYTMIGG